MTTKKRAWTILLMVVLILALVAGTIGCEAEKPRKLIIAWDLTPSYLMDIGIAKTLLEEIGYEVEFVGIDNAPYCEFARPPLTSVSQRFRERGSRAVEMLIAMTNGTETRSVLLQPVLHVRASSG